uniref:Uncharacterized protein n=1 Tax=Triticum urartu TaxID=4572 RepID=A0A8R7THD8_TRIUA
MGSSEPGARDRPTSGTRSSGASGPSRWFGGRGRGRRSATREEQAGPASSWRMSSCSSSSASSPSVHPIATQLQEHRLQFQFHRRTRSLL